MIDPVPSFPKRKALSPEQIAQWDKMIFSWGFAAEKNKKILPQILEVPSLAEIYAQGYYVASLLNFLFDDNNSSKE